MAKPAELMQGDFWRAAQIPELAPMHGRSPALLVHRHRGCGDSIHRRPPFPNIIIAAKTPAAAMPQFGIPLISVDSPSHVPMPLAVVMLAPLESSVEPGCVSCGAVWEVGTATVGEGAGETGGG
jgi:hypothetical protein